MTSRMNKNRLIVALLFLIAVTTPVKSQQGWMATRIAPADQDLNTVYFLDDKRGWVGGDNGFLSRTEDGGHSWVKQTVQTTAAINDIYFRDKEAGFLIAGNAIFATRDNGVRWNEVRRFLPGEFDGADIELYSVRFSSKKKGWVVGSVSKRERVIDSILLYTDGLTESFNLEGEFFGEERLMEAIRANQCASASDLLDVVEKSLLNFVQDMPPADDLTMLVLRRT